MIFVLKTMNFMIPESVKMALIPFERIDAHTENIIN